MPDKATDSAKRTLVEEGTEFHGTMKSSCPVTVNGRIEGELTAPRLDVTESGSVVGTIKADELNSRGKLSGNIDAGALSLSGSVGSNTVIKAKKLEVKLAPSQGRMQVSFGECTLDVGDEPTKEISKPVEDAAAAQEADDKAQAKPSDAIQAKAEKAAVAIADGKPSEGKSGDGKALDGKTGDAKNAKPLDPGPDPKPRMDGKADGVVPPPQPIAGVSDPGAPPPAGDASKKGDVEGNTAEAKG